MNLSEKRSLELWYFYLTAGDTAYAAYEHDPVEAQLHELGHLFCAEGIGAVRIPSWDINAVCGDIAGGMKAQDENEYEAIAFTFLVTRAFGYRTADTEQFIAQDANIQRYIAAQERNVAAVRRCETKPRVKRLAAKFVKMIPCLSGFCSTER